MDGQPTSRAAETGEMWTRVRRGLGHVRLCVFGEHRLKAIGGCLDILPVDCGQEERWGTKEIEEILE